MTEVSKEAVEALAEILMSSFPEVSFVGLDMSVDFINRLSKSGYTIAPIAPVTDEKLRELSVLAQDILDGEGYYEVALEVKAALSELAKLRAASQAVVARWDGPKWKDLPATAEFINAMRELLPTPPKED